MRPIIYFRIHRIYRINSKWTSSLTEWSIDSILNIVWILFWNCIYVKFYSRLSWPIFDFFFETNEKWSGKNDPEQNGINCKIDWIQSQYIQVHGHSAPTAYHFWSSFIDEMNKEKRKKHIFWFWLRLRYGYELQAKQMELNQIHFSISCRF